MFARASMHGHRPRILTKSTWAFTSLSFKLFLQARVVLYKQGKLMKELKFNALGSDKLNWFTHSRLGKSPWSDINTQPKNFFSIGGMHQRYFFINRNYGGCGADAGWMVVTVGIHCNWEKHFQPSRDVQVILYSRLSGHTNWNHFGE